MIKSVAWEMLGKDKINSAEKSHLLIEAWLFQ